MANRSPPIPQPVGSMSPKAAFTAMAASMAFPPFFRTSIPICVARGWLEATIPFWAMTSDRVAKSSPVMRSCEYSWVAMTKMMKIYVFMGIKFWKLTMI